MSQNADFDLRPLKIEELRDMLVNNQIIINENYQRSPIWRDAQKIKLIESISINYPIGILVLIDKGKNKYEVIDGQQRVSAIGEFVSSDLDNIEGKRFDELDSREQKQFLQYKVPSIILNSNLSEDQISSIFVRLQEGIPLSTGEKVYSFVGKFRNTFVNTFLDVKNKKFFSNINDRRFKARLLAAHFLAIELGADYGKKIFPDIGFTDLIKINEKEYKKKDIPKDIVLAYNENIQFLGKYLGETLSALKVREITPLYLLASYMRWNGTQDSKRGNKLNDFIEDFRDDLDKFSIYAETPPKGMSAKDFGSLMKYKAYSRQALSGESLSVRLDIMLDEFTKRMKMKV